MMKELICICCPRGCHLKVDEEKKEVTGNACPRGKEYGINEVTNPVRVVTSTVKITGANLRRLPDKTDKPIPKGKIFDILDEIKPVVVKAPVKIGDVIVPNVAGTGVDVIATKNIQAV